MKDDSADQSRNERGNHLAGKGDARGNLEVVCHLQVVGERKCVCTSDVSVRLEEVHGKRIALNNHTTNELSKDVQSNFNTGHSADNADGDDKDEAEENTVQNDSGGSVGRPSGDTNNTEDDGDKQTAEIPVLRHCNR